MENKGSYSLNNISQNPYRILGVAANATKKDIIANANKFKAFLKVGKTFSAPFDNLPGVFQVERTNEAIDSAEKEIELPIGQLKYTLFWFVDETPIDKIALNHVRAGNIETAVKIWSKVETVSSLINLVVSSLINHDWSYASFYADRLFTNYTEKLCSLVDETLSLTKERLMSLFIDTIAKDNINVLKAMCSSLSYGDGDLAYTPKEWISCIRKALVSPYSDEANDKIAEFNSIPKDEYEKRYKYAKSKLLNGLSEICNYLGEDSSEYKILNRQIVDASLQSAINYFNHSINKDIIAFDVKDFVKLIMSKAIPGSISYARCKDNYDTLCNICSNLPPKSVVYYHRLLKGVIDGFQDESPSIQGAFTFIQKCYPYLMSIKSVLGSSDAYYQKMCTRVAKDALGDIITDYNKKSEFLHDKLEEGTLSNRSKIIELIREMMKTAVIAMYHMGMLELEPDFREDRFQKNYDIIVEQARNAGVFGGDEIPFIVTKTSEADFDHGLKLNGPDQRDEKEYYSSIKNIEDCNTYRRIFPKGKYTEQINSRLEEFEYNGCLSLEDLKKFNAHYPLTKFNIEAKREEIIFKSCKTIEDYKLYLTKYSKYKKEAQQKIDDLAFEECQNRDSYSNYLNTFPSGAHRNESQRRIDDMDFRACKNATDFENYLKNHSTGYHVEAAKKRLAEETLWALCIKKDSWKLYKDYLSKYPYGEHRQKAEANSKSPLEQISKWAGNHGCLLAFVTICIGVLVFIGIKFGSEGIGYTFAVLGAFGVLGAISAQSDLECGTRVVSFLCGIFFGLIGIAIISFDEERNKASIAENSYNSLNDSSSVSDYREVVKANYYDLDATHKDDMIRKYFSLSLDSCIATIGKYSFSEYGNGNSGLGYLKDFIANCPNPSYKNRAEARFSELVDSLYNAAKRLNTYKAWEKYQVAVPSVDFKDSEERMEAADPRWNTDRKAWDTAQSLNSIDGYNKYLTLYPKGRHSREADKKVIDMTVSSSFAGEHSDLPAMNQVRNGGGSTSHVSVSNITSYTLTLMYSGNDSKRLVIPPNGSGTVTLKNGIYRIAAYVDAPNVNTYAGTESLNGGSYDVSYYISNY